MAQADGPRSRRHSLAAPIALAGARLREAPGRAALVSAGVAIAIAFLVGALAGGLVARASATSRALDDLPAAERAFRIDAFGLPPGQSHRATDREARAALARLTPRAASQAVVYREMRFGTRLVRLARARGIRPPEAARGTAPACLHGGALRGACRSAPATTPSWSARDVRLVRVGRAELTNPAALAGLQLDTPTRSGP